jgi:hypothetical protein
MQHAAEAYSFHVESIHGNARFVLKHGSAALMFKDSLKRRKSCLVTSDEKAKENVGDDPSFEKETAFECCTTYVDEIKCADTAYSRVASDTAVFNSNWN